MKYITREKRSYAGIGLLTGVILGGFLGNHIAHNSANHTGLFREANNSSTVFIGTGVGIFLGGIFGFAAGSGLGSDEYYDLSSRNLDEKKTLLSKLISASQN